MAEGSSSRLRNELPEVPAREHQIAAFETACRMAGDNSRRSSGVNGIRMFSGQRPSTAPMVTKGEADIPGERQSRLPDCRQYFHFKLLYPYKKSIWTYCRLKRS